MSRVLLLTLLFSILLATTACPAAESRPNVIVILADDLEYGDTSLFDGWVRTPQIERLASEGLTFTDFHTNSSVCSPTRAAFLTGRYQQRVGIIDVIARHLDTPGLEATELTIPRLMKQNGYRTALFGKWHLGTEPRHNPIHHGFDECAGPALIQTINSSLKWLTEVVRDRADRLSAGQIFLTGSIPSLIPIAEDCGIRVDAPPFGSVVVKFITCPSS